MTLKELQNEIVAIHNRVVEINVHGDDAIRMAEVISRCRSAVAAIENSYNSESESCEPDCE